MKTHSLLTGKFNLLLLICSITATQLTGCFTVGQEFAASRVSEIKIGQTRKQDINDLFGTPWRTGLEDGHTTWTYGIYKYSIFGNNDTQDLLLRFDPQGLVRSYTFSTTRK
ncbi:outer membrane protein assembly factor BamE [Methylomonas sp. AM2-LC]|uniref:outer membrane protein assembly factor BamE domain-containing protein n=1 Tax=Methylomonas sp. AM2-LC TaxID=3153301 RepID=UPI0032638386